MSTAADAPSPTVLAGRYRLERRVAQGGMAEVWLATDTALSRQVAVKLLKPTLAADPVVAERFRREAIAVASVTHPNIVAVYDAVEDNGRQAVVMQYVQGKTLRQLLDEQGRLSPELTVHIGCALASALDAAHSAGLVHRDVKPGNVLVTPDGRVQLADFGIAKALGSGDDLTSDNVMMGTAKYLSPEQVRGRRLDGRADLYSLGLVLYECLAGKVPFLGETDADTALARLQRDATDLNRLRPTLPRQVAAVVHRLMEREPEHRYATGAAVRAALTDSLSAPAPAPAEPWTPVPSRPTPRLFDDEREDTGGHVWPELDGDDGPYDDDLDDLDDVTPDSATVHLDPILAGARRDPTPPRAAAPRPRPNREMQQRWAPSLVVIGVLLLLALVVGLVVWSSLGEGGSAFDAEDPLTEGPARTDATGGATVPVVPGVDATTGANGAPGIAAVSVFDPVDGDPGTAWHTVCYESPYFGGKRGVGLVVALDGPTDGTVSIDVASAPWIVNVFAVDGVASGDLEDWGDPVLEDFGNEPETITVDLRRPASSVLVLMKQGASSPACSDDNPNRGAIAEVSVQGG